MLVLNQPLELSEAFQHGVQPARVEARTRAAERAHDFLFVLRVLVFEIDLGVERSGEIGRQVAWILRADGDAGAERPALAGEVR